MEDVINGLIEELEELGELIEGFDLRSIRKYNRRSDRRAGLGELEEGWESWLEDWRAGELESCRAGELKNRRAGELER